MNKKKNMYKSVLLLEIDHIIILMPTASSEVFSLILCQWMVFVLFTTYYSCLGVMGTGYGIGKSFSTLPALEIMHNSLFSIKIVSSYVARQFFTIKYIHIFSWQHRFSKTMNCVTSGWWTDQLQLSRPYRLSGLVGKIWLNQIQKFYFYSYFP